MFRFVQNYKVKDHRTRPLDTIEMEKVQLYLAKIVQRQCFREEVRNIENSTTIILNNPNRFVDKNGI